MAKQSLNEMFAAGLKKFSADQLNLSFNPDRPDLKATPAQLNIMQDTEALSIFVVGGNRSGKSQLGSRITSWWFNNSHPYMQRPPEWGTGPLTIMVIGRVGEQIESELFVNKIKPYLHEGTYKQVKIGNILQRLEHENGNRIIFFSHHNINEAREKVQAFTTHFIWLDEMADSASFIAELQTRLITTRGRMIATFTPLIRSEEVRQLVDNSIMPVARKVQLSMLDNPMIANNPERLAEVMMQFANYSEAERRTRLFGDWYQGEGAVYEFSAEKHSAAPNQYSKRWKHIVSVDPAMSGKTGVTIWAEEPSTGVWYCILAEYLENILSPVELVAAVERLCAGMNIIRRVSDPHEVWYISQASALPFRLAYVGVYKKSERKKELIKNLQTALTEGAIKLHPDMTKKLANELISCRWAETVEERIVNATKYHLLDSAQYFVDNKPKWVPSESAQNESPTAAYYAALRQANKEQRTPRQPVRMKRLSRFRR